MMILTSAELPALPGTFLQPEGPLPEEWSRLKAETDVTLVLTEGASAAALAFKVWPELCRNVTRILYAGGTLAHGDATPFAERSVYRDPYAVESLLNVGVPFVFITPEAAEAHNMPPEALAISVARYPALYPLMECGVHVETQKCSPAFGRLIADLDSDSKFPRRHVSFVC